MTTTTVLLDTNLLLLARSYHLAKTQENNQHLELLSPKAMRIYEDIDNHANDGNPFYISDMSVVEMKVVHIRNSLHEFARNVYQMPAGSLYDNKGGILGKLRPKFNESQFSPTAQEFRNLLDSWGIWHKLRILPDALSESERTTWRKRQEIIFKIVGDYAGFETQDAYIFASAMAIGTDEIWTADSGFRSAIEELRKANFSDLLRSIDESLFSDLPMPKPKKIKIE